MVQTLRGYFTDPEAIRSGGVKMIPIRTPRGEFRVWTKRFGKNPRIRVLLLHGGPGATHDYFESFEGFLPAEGIEFIYYDQLGSGNSDRPDDPDLWTIERFVDEVEQVRLALGLDRDAFFLLGNSWGAMLAVEYALLHGDHLKGLVISNMMMSMPAYVRYVEGVLATQMEPGVVEEIKDLEARGLHESPRYMELLGPNFYARHICRLPEWPEPVVRCFARLNKDVYMLMQGPSEFGSSGRISGWDRTADLARITTPTLVIGATHDTMDPVHMRWVAGQVANGSFLLCPSGSHLSFWDDQDVYFEGLIRWLKAIDRPNPGASARRARAPRSSAPRG